MNIIGAIAWPAGIIALLIVMKILGDWSYKRWKAKLDRETAALVAGMRSEAARRRNL